MMQAIHISLRKKLDCCAETSVENATGKAHSPEAFQIRHPRCYFCINEKMLFRLSPDSLHRRNSTNGKGLRLWPLLLLAINHQSDLHTNVWFICRCIHSRNPRPFSNVKCLINLPIQIIKSPELNFVRPFFFFTFSFLQKNHHCAHDIRQRRCRPIFRPTARHLEWASSGWSRLPLVFCVKHHFQFNS